MRNRSARASSAQLHTMRSFVKSFLWFESELFSKKVFLRKGDSVLECFSKLC